jgi:periplasmic protein TonB
MEAQALKVFATPEPTTRRAAGIAFVVALHAGLITALILGLAPPDFVRQIVKDITVVALPPTNPPVDDHFKPVTPIDTKVHVDQPIIDTEDSDAITDSNIVGPGQGGGNQAVTSPVGPSGVMNTHTIPPYPPISIRIGEEGVVSLRIAISNEGFVTDAVVTRSSGHPRLDDAAVAWVKAHWRYRPAQENGVPVASTTSAQVKFELRNAR